MCYWTSAFFVSYWTSGIFVCSELLQLVLDMEGPP